MFVSESTPGLERTALNSRGLISHPDTLKKLKASGVDVLYIDTSKGKTSQFATPVSTEKNGNLPGVELFEVPNRGEKAHSPVGTIELFEERHRAEKVYGEARSLVGNLMGNVKLGKPIEVGPIEDLAEEISGSVLANSNALMCLSQIREKDKYLLEHSINVGILMGVFARYLGYNDDTLHQMVTGALLHDIGKIRVPTHILNKQGKLTEKEWVEMQNHVAYGEEVLLKSQGISEIALAICGQHHEKLGGGGYPRNLSGNEISKVGRISSIVDIYDAITADRCYHNGKSPFTTMRILVDLGKKDLDKNLVYQFVRCIGIYPVGTLVELDGNRLAVVEEVNIKSPELPIVKVFFNLKTRKFLEETMLDLSDSKVGLTVLKAHAPEAVGIKVKDVI